MCVAGMPAFAAELTAEQLRLLEQLSPVQREQLLRSLQQDAAKEKETEAPDSQEISRPKTRRDPAGAGAAAAALKPRLKAGDTLLLKFELEKGKQKTGGKPARADADDLDKKARMERLPKSGLYTLDKAGVLYLPNIGWITVSGLTEDEAALRIQAEPLLQDITAAIKVLPVTEELKPFGYDLFSEVPTTFAPATDIPVPADYVVGPGDTVLVQLFGKESVQHRLTVTREGLLQFPGIGPIPVAGLKFSRLQEVLAGRIQRQMLGVQTSIALGKLRSIRVFVLGDVEKPGSYTVSGLSTLTNALFASGGVKRIGSLRDIQLKRDGKIVGRLDLYDLLLQGDTSADARLLPGDVIFVPPVGRTVGVSGEVRRPAIYELKQEGTLEQAIGLAGGLTPSAFPQGVRIERINPERRRMLLDLDLTHGDGRAAPVLDGDRVRVGSVLDKIEGMVLLSGHIQRPGGYQWVPGMHLSDLISSTADLLPEVDTRYVLVKREDLTDRTISLLNADLAAALKQPKGEADLELKPGDTVYVFSVRGSRTPVIEPLLERARAQSRYDQPVREVTIDGMVHHPGHYPLSPQMKVSALLQAAGGLTDNAYTLEAELTRFTVVDNKRREAQRLQVNLAGLLQGEPDADLTLASYDQLVVRRVPHWDPDGTIQVLGEVRFPGGYPLVRGDKLSDVLRRVGGLTAQAFPKGVVFTRESVRQKEQEYLNRLADQLERELAAAIARGNEIGVEAAKGAAETRALLGQLRNAKAVGRMVVNLPALLREDPNYDVVVQDGDKLYIPQRPDEVTVLGEVYHPTSHLYRRDLDTDDFIQLSGGVTKKGDKGAIYVVHADGAVTPASRGLFRRSSIGPGDTVVVPFKIDRISNLKLATDVTQILYQLAITAASLKVIGAL